MNIHTTRRARIAAGAVGFAAVASMLLATPALAGSSRDSDHDGMPNSWERAHHLNWRVANASKDADHDGLSNLREYTLRLDPRSDDSDDDGIEDGNEDRDDDGVENLNDNEDVCQLLGTSALQYSDDDEQGEDCDDQGEDQNEDQLESQDD